MKVILYFSFIILILPRYSQNANNYKITYELTYKPDTTDLNQIKKERMLLYTNSKSSLFLSYGRILKDSMRGKFGIGDIGSTAYKKASAAAKTDFSYRLYKRPLESEVFHCLKIATDNYYYSEISSFDWQINQETKTILGYSAQKATAHFAGRYYEAWFSTEIAIPEGPYKFSGLPGLILEISSTDKDYKFSIVGLEKTSFFPVSQIPPKSFQQSPKKELLELQKEYYNDPIGFINNWVGKGGRTVHIGLQGKAKRDHYAKYGKSGMPSLNNFLELD
ncbi:GLPGLI family protein [Leeuwenhoekiella polynyae]|uniref:GLPGLI family protein n=1 Tax=Leeuwenhoekiella polynyae TaxID=1550906 RepID=A0A4Q0NQV4_9FLAO|nr:GLPGLI family protein [Leeuwenhoekiella polynyae]RXG12829.1 GLPGLI family protein [Leeuwenhoekiella polynyae]